MGAKDTAVVTTTIYKTTVSPPPPTSPPHTLSSPNSHPPQSNVVASPCAACKILRRRCAEKCVLAPYFPPTEPLKFTIAHRVFGASNIIKFLQELPESQRSDAVSSMVYEANARVRDPVYGCAGAICQLQKQVNELQAQLAKAQAEVVNMRCQQAHIMAQLLTTTTTNHHDHSDNNQSPPRRPLSLSNSSSPSSSSEPERYFPRDTNMMIVSNNSGNGVGHAAGCYVEVEENGLGTYWETLDMII